MLPRMRDVFSASQGARWALPLAACLAAGAVFPACAGDEQEVDAPDTTPDPQPNPTPDPDPDKDPDKDPVPLACPPVEGRAEQLASAWKARNVEPETSSNDVVEVDGYLVRAVIDASAGGAADAPSHSYRYVDLRTGSLVAIGDTTAVTSDAWHIALRRTALRVNSGDSGAGSVKLARLADTRFDDVFAVPLEPMWADDTADWTLETVVNPDTDKEEDVCVLSRDNFGLPYAAINKVNVDTEPSGSWYAYGGPGGVAPVPDAVYLLQVDDGTTWKLGIDAFGDGVWSLRWEELFGECNATVAGVDEATALGLKTTLFPYPTASSVADNGDGTWTALLQASVGGYGGAHSMTFVDLNEGALRAYTDVQAASADDWTLAVRRQGLRINSGAAGGGAVSIARLTDTTLAAVDAVPADLRFETEALRYRWMPDGTAAPACGFAREPMGQAEAAINRLNPDREPMQSWHSYIGGVIAPYAGVIYLLRDENAGKVFALEIAAYDVDAVTKDVRWTLHWKVIQSF